MGKPQKLTELTAGLAIGAGKNEGFVETFNWLVRFCKNLQGDGANIEIENDLGDQPTIEWVGQIGNVGGGGSDYTPWPRPFDYDEQTHVIKKGIIYIGRSETTVNLNGYTVSSSGSYYIQITHNYGGTYSTAIVKATNPANTDTVSYFHLYDIDANLKVTMDYRGVYTMPFYSN